MTLSAFVWRTPRLPPRGGASVRVGAVLVAAMLWSALPLLAQEPPDTVSLPDSLAAPDSIALDSLAAADTVPADSLSADTIFYNLPRPTGRAASGFATGIWRWDRHGIMASGANTLGELVQDLPGVVTLLGGDYGTAAAISAFGQGGAGYRIFRDGFELYPVDGGVVDLQRVPLVGISEVRVDRSMGQILIEMTSYQYEEGRAFSIVEAGTGDLDTNMFRGLFADPTALGGSLGVGLERVDTRGRAPDRGEGGNRTGSWLRYQLHMGDRFGVGLDYRTNQSQTRVSEYTPTVSRSDVVARAAFRISEGVVASALAGRSSHSIDGTDAVSVEGGQRRQFGATLAADLRGLWLEASARRFQGAVPSSSIDASAGYTHPELGGVSARVSRGNFDGTTATAVNARAWLSPSRHLTLFGAVSDGVYGAPTGPVSDGFEPPAPPPENIVPGIPLFTDRRTSRFGAAAGWQGVEVAAAKLYAWSDQVLPLGTELDRGSVPVPGVHRNGYEGTVVLPTRWRAFTFQGSYQWWDEVGPYLPDEIYRASFEYHKIFKESGNLELWGSLGVRGHNPMPTFVAEDGLTPSVEQVPFFQSWYARFQVRVVTVRLWIGIDNASLRRFNQTYPDRLLPLTRTFFALRWDLWN